LAADRPDDAAFCGFNRCCLGRAALLLLVVARDDDGALRRACARGDLSRRGLAQQVLGGLLEDGLDVRPVERGRLEVREVVQCGSASVRASRSQRGRLSKLQRSVMS
jgi:hypothetical protein